MPAFGNDVVLFDNNGQPLGTAANPLVVAAPGGGEDVNLKSVGGTIIGWGSGVQTNKVPVDLFDGSGNLIESGQMFDPTVVDTQRGLKTLAAVYGHRIDANQPYPIDANPGSVVYNAAGIELAVRANINGVNGAALSATNGLFTNILQGNAALSTTNGIYGNILQTNAVLSATNGIFSNILQGNAVLAAGNPIFSTLTIAGALVSATNGTYANLLQGNAVISTTNGLYTNLLQGNAVISATNPVFTDLVRVGGSAVALGQTTMAASIPVVLANNPTQSGTAAWPVTLYQGTTAIGGGNPIAARLLDGSLNPLTFNQSGATVANTSYNAPVAAMNYGWDVANGARFMRIDARAQNGTFTAGDTALNTNSNLWGVNGAALSATNPVFTVSVPVSAAANSPTNYTSSALEASAVIKASAGTLYQVVVANGATAQWIQFFNSTTVPGDTTVPTGPVFRVGATTTLIITFPQLMGRYFSTGISVSNSSTQATKTIGAADCFFDASYK